MKALLVFLLLISTAQASWMLHDISILFPRPKMPMAETALKANTQGSLGVLFPESVATKLPQLIPSIPKNEQIKRLEVVAVRIAPPEIRLVWGIFDGPRVIGLDLAAHTFYHLSDDAQFLKELKQISGLTRSDVHSALPLSVHPTLAREGMEGPYGVALRELLLKHIGEKNLFKATFMGMSAVHLKWDFGGFTVNNGKTAPLKIARTNTNKVQIFTNDAFPASYFSGGIGPAPKGQDAFNRYVSDSQKPRNRELENLKSAHASALRIENPKLETSDTIDCASCHVAQQVRLLTEYEEVTLRDVTASRYMNSSFNLQNKSPMRASTDNVHAFGWFGANPSINQRTINETAEVASQLNQF